VIRDRLRSMNKEHRTLASIERAIKQPGGPDFGQMLTPRQTEVIRLTARGYSAKQVARKLGISKDTVWDERSQICKRLGEPDALNAVKECLRTGIVTVRDLLRRPLEAS